MNHPVHTLVFATLLLAGLQLANVHGAEPDSCTLESAQSGSSQTDHFSANHQAIGHPTFVSPHASPIAVSNGRVFVANTPSDTVDVIDTDTQRIQARIPVGVDPVSIAVRPDGKEVWVSNHVSDSVSVIDADRTSPTYLQIIATIQEFDKETRATEFDEPVGIAFASNQKAYVALSSENQIAVVNVESREIEKRLRIPAQDPRAITVRDGRLYVLPFESNNKTQLSGGTGKLDGDLVTFNAWEHAIANNNVLSLGAVLDIIKHPKVPDRDLFVYDTETDELLSTVDTLGTLLYGLTVDSKGRVFVAQTDARNDVNGRSGTKQHGLAELENRAFMNRITRVDFDAETKGTATFLDLEPLPPHHPAPDDALATPFAIQVSEDDSTLVVSAAGSDKLFTVDANTGLVLGRANVGAVPRGIALEHAPSGKATRAWVLNAVENSVTLVNIAMPMTPDVVDTLALNDPTHPAVKRGRIAFNTATASTTNTFSCASCHPDGHTDQLLWVLKTPIVTGGDQIMPRSTMPIRGLRDTAPYHWDGIPGDPYGGNNSANVHGSDDPNSTTDDPASTTRHLIDGGLAATMGLVGDSTVNDEGKAGKLSAAERDDMATFLLSVPFPPAQRRAYTNVVSKRAEEGFRLFHIEGDDDDKPQNNVCGDCHRMPFLVSTNTPGTGMDAPTWRGAYDRFLILPQGRLNIIDFDFYRSIAERGIPERNMWQFSWGGRREFDPVWDMVLEGSTGFSGSFGRQATLNRHSADDELTADLLGALETSALENAVVLTGEGAFVDGNETTPVSLQFDTDSGHYRHVDTSYSREELIRLAAEGKFIGTLTARHGQKDDVDYPQPAIWTLGPIEQQRGRQDFPIVHEDNPTIAFSGRHVIDGAQVFVDGRRVSADVTIEPSDELIQIKLSSLPSAGMHLLQLQNPGGMFSNDFIFHVADNEEAAADLKRANRGDRNSELNATAAQGDVRRLQMLLDKGAKPNARNGESGSTPLHDAALFGQKEAVEFLLDNGAFVNRSNRDGNTPLHAAAFMCNFEIVALLLERGASPTRENDAGDSAIEAVSAEWSRELAGFYALITGGLRIEADLDRIRRDRPRMAALLRKHED